MRRPFCGPLCLNPLHPLSGGFFGLWPGGRSRLCRFAPKSVIPLAAARRSPGGHCGLHFVPGRCLPVVASLLPPGTALTRLRSAQTFCVRLSCDTSTARWPAILRGMPSFASHPFSRDAKDRALRSASRPGFAANRPISFRDADLTPLTSASRYPRARNAVGVKRYS